MKKTVVTIVVTACITAFITYCITTSAKRPPVPAEVEVPEKADPSWSLQPKGKTYDTVSIYNAIKSVYRLDSTWNALTKTHAGCPVKAFTIHADELLASLGIRHNSAMYQHKYVRVYLGMAAQDSFKLFVVPVINKNPDCDSCYGNDYFFNFIKDSLSISLKPDAGSYVLDLNAPCPYTCDTRSPLYRPVICGNGPVY